jgi:aspartate-semialdehyde dehydrogenase
MKIAVVGATGLVGREMLKVIEEHKLPVDELIPAASERSVGKTISFNGRDYLITGVQETVNLHPDLAIFSAGAAASKRWAPEFAKGGTTVIDNSSAWRQNIDIPLIVPEINARILGKKDKIIANPNCSTIQMVLTLAPLHRKYRIKRIVVATYQSVSGTGLKAVRQLENERKGIIGERAYPHVIDLNVIPHAGVFNANGYTSEEEKLSFETRKILDDQTIKVTATVVRVPVFGGHSEAVNVEFEKPFDLDELRNILMQQKGIVVQDNIAEAVYPMPVNAMGKDEVFVGRIRRDDTVENGLNLWIVSDSLRKGAATNAIQIAEWLINNELVN